MGGTYEQFLISEPKRGKIIVGCKYPNLFPFRMAKIIKHPNCKDFSLQQQSVLRNYGIYLNKEPWYHMNFRCIFSYILLREHIIECERFHFVMRPNWLTVMDVALYHIFNAFIRNDSIGRQAKKWVLDHWPSMNFSKKNVELCREWSGCKLWYEIPASKREQMVLIMTRNFSQGYDFPCFTFIKGILKEFKVGKRVGYIDVIDTGFQEPGNKAPKHFLITDVGINSIPVTIRVPTKKEINEKDEKKRKKPVVLLGIMVCGYVMTKLHGDDAEIEKMKQYIDWLYSNRNSDSIKEFGQNSKQILLEMCEVGYEMLKDFKREVSNNLNDEYDTTYYNGNNESPYVNFKRQVQECPVVCSLVNAPIKDNSKFGKRWMTKLSLVFEPNLGIAECDPKRKFESPSARHKTTVYSEELYHGDKKLYIGKKKNNDENKDENNDENKDDVYCIEKSKKFVSKHYKTPK